MASNKRKDDKGRVLKDGESQNKKDGRYCYRYTVHGKRKAIYSNSLPELRDMEQKILRDIADGIVSDEAEKITLNDEFSRYMENKILKENVKASYYYFYDIHVRNTFGEEKIAKIRYSDILTFYKKLMTDDGLQIGSVSIIHKLIRPTFELAVRDGLIRSNPTVGIMRELNSHGKKPQKRKALTKAEQDIFIEWCSSRKAYEKWKPLFVILLGTGLRIGEALGLTWKDCDFSKNIISVNHSLIYKPRNGSKENEFRINTPKTAAGRREIPMLSEVRKTLLQIRQEQMASGIGSVEVDGLTDFVFRNSHGNLLQSSYINGVINRICKRYNDWEKAMAEIEHRDPVLLPHFSVHSLRHTFCTRLCENETNIKIIQTVMGHSNISMTMDIYAEATRDAKIDAFKELDKKMKIC